MVTGPSIFNYSQNLTPIFEGDSYDYWSIQMKTLFMSHDLWEIVEKGYTAPANEEELARLTANQLQKYKRDKMKDARALLFIQQGVSKTIFPRIVNAVTSKEAWEILKTEFQGMTALLLDKGSIQKHDKIGCTPLHLAAGFGNVEILKKLLNKDRSVAYKVDNDGCTALHVAANYGQVDIMQELISICPGCCELVDNKGRNVLHYATKSKNRNTVRLVLRNPSFGNLINEKDNKGNTPFLKAVSMLSIINHPTVDRLVFNNDNDNAATIPVKDHNPRIWKWHEFIRWILIRGEIRRGRRLMSNDKYGEGKENKSNPAVSSKSKDGDENGNGRSSRDDAENNARQNNELVAATLIATVTFAAGLTVPGGYISEKGPDQGAAILTRNTAFEVFVLLNSMSMFLSSLAVFTHLFRFDSLEAHKTWNRKKRLRRFLIVFAMLAMIGAFLSGTCAVLYRDRNLAISACVVPVAVLAFLTLVNIREPLLYLFVGLTNRKSLYNLVCVLDELWYEISQGGFKNLIRNKVVCVVMVYVRRIVAS
ncbi:hypothetical protein EZV62_002868 [Acer yangbiense]|uniref:PGG domain-containing protein n=1 Tax=Acer yangbiense TaxID=1000413 RepID=A0A5C7IYR9_9ROSI|nr:hypothetical protein EZV62_002868 [Acer yangbiense]